MLEDIAIVVDYLYLKYFFNNDVDKIISFLNVVGPKNIDGNTNEKTKYYQKIVTNKLLMSQFIIDNNINKLRFCSFIFINDKKLTIKTTIYFLYRLCSIIG